MRPHGYARYRLNQCHCLVCKRANSVYSKRVTMAKLTGAWCPYIDAEPVRQHVMALSRAGIGYKRIARLAGVNYSRIQALTFGHNGEAPSKRIRPAIASRILAVRPSIDNLADGQRVDATGTVRRIHALAAIGWSLAEQAQQVGCSKQNIHRISGGALVTAGNARRIAVLYDRLSMTTAPDSAGARRIRKMATDRVWAPPLAWDDESIDDPTARPRGWLGAPEAVSLAEFAARYAPLADLPWADIADRLSLTVDAAKARARRARAAGLLDREELAS